jgi:spore maturation protein CgeB
MHFSDIPSECGNMRTYETPAHGMLMICDKASANAHACIFEPDKEAVYYDNIDQAIELIEYYLHNEDERMKIAKAGYERFWRDYEWESNLLKFLKWCESVRNLETDDLIGIAQKKS